MKAVIQLSNIAALALAYVLMVLEPSWLAVMNCIGWTAAWYYYFTACQFIDELIAEGVLMEVEDDD